MIAGSDRVKEFERLLESYNGVEGKDTDTISLTVSKLFLLEKETQMQRVSRVCLLLR